MKIDHEMEAVARLLWPSAQRPTVVSGGLFNRVARVQTATGAKYLKRFTDVASSGDFPPLPTTAAQRCLVAASWHDLAFAAAAREPRVVGVPALLAVQTDAQVVAMDHAPGEPLYEALIAGQPDLLGALRKTSAWLATLHTSSLEPREQLLAASKPFKAFKVDLQYTRVLQEIPSALHQPARRFISSYLETVSEPIHGDLNSRNILAAEDAVWIIDFEQGHFGEGVYDLAYLLSEFVIRDLRKGADPQESVNVAWEAYRRARSWSGEHTAWRRFRIHLAFQTLYRLVGPSRTVWTGHLGAEEQNSLRRWSLTELLGWLQ